MPKNLDKPLLQKMKEAGCQRLQYGVESGSPAVIIDMGKTFKPEEATKIIRWTDEVGICGTVNLIAGFPTETEQNLRETMKFLKNSLSNTTHITINLFMFGLSNESIIEKVPERFNILIKHPKKQGLLGNYTTPPIYIKPGIGDPYPQKQDHYRKIVEFIKNNNLKFQNAGDVRRMLEMINVDNKRAKLK